MEKHPLGSRPNLEPRSSSRASRRLPTLLTAVLAVFVYQILLSTFGDGIRGYLTAQYQRFFGIRYDAQGSQAFNWQDVSFASCFICRKISSPCFEPCSFLLRYRIPLSCTFPNQSCRHRLSTSACLRFPKSECRVGAQSRTTSSGSSRNRLSSIGMQPPLVTH